MPITSYSMSCFKFPNTFCEELKRMIVKFGGKNNRMRESFIELIKNRCVNLRVRARWDLKIG